MEKKGQMRNTGTAWFLVNLIFGLYLLNSGLNFIKLSFITESINSWIIIIGGALLIISGVMSFMRRTPYIPRYR
jgi:hypothetical protein